MKYSEIKAVKAFCNELYSKPNWREVVDNLVNFEWDFTVEGVRFINETAIDSIQCDELAADDYKLGRFASWLLADVLTIPKHLIDRMQMNGEYETLGMLVKSQDGLEDLQKEYSKIDGYGHHFNGYDGSEQELRLPNGEFYWVFDEQVWINLMMNILYMCKVMR